MRKAVHFFKTIEGKYVMPLVEGREDGIYEDIPAVCYDDGTPVQDKVLKKLFAVDGLRFFVDDETFELTVELYNHNPEGEE